jgi:predicted CXXCH cytochrome family protein
MTRLHAPLLRATLLLTAACLPELEPVPELVESAPRIDVSEHWQVEIDAHLPSDVIPLPDGGFWVLDGDVGQAHAYDADHNLLGIVGDATTWGHPVRMANASAGGVWMVDPLGDLVRVDVAGAVAQRIVMPASEDTAGVAADTGALGVHGAVSVYDSNTMLVVGDRDGHLSWLEPGTGRVVKQLSTNVDNEPLGIITDITGWPSGGILTVDTLHAQVEQRDDQGAATSAFGRYGLWAGYLRKPKSAAIIDGRTVAIADSSLGVVQLFDPTGRALGLLAENGAPLRFSHPIDVERAGDWLYVLDAQTATLHGLKLTDGALQDQTPAVDTRWLREPLVVAERSVAAEAGAACLQCHDGFVQESRQVWDPDLHQHPVDMVPERELPGFFPLGDDGAMRCATCHSPHGTTDEAFAANVPNEEERAKLVRHATPDSLFTRVSAEGSALCVACHADTAHDGAVKDMGLESSGHLAGAKLAKAMEKRAPEDRDVLSEEGCLGCHAVHGAAESTLTRGLTDGRLCTGCHAEQSRPLVNHPVGRPDSDGPAPSNRLPLSEDGEVSCNTCHDLLGSAHALVRATPNALCLDCHEDRKRVLAGAHAKVKGIGGIACLGCHDVHGGATTQDLLTHAGNEIDPNGCGDCHGESGKHARVGVRPGTLGHTVDGKTHDGMDGELTCASCHDAHVPASDTECQTCHEPEGAAQLRGGHGETTCLDCHPAHSTSPTFTADPEEINPASWRCLSCHSDSAANNKAQAISDYQHPAPVFLPDGTRWAPLAGMPLFTADGSPAKKGENGDLTCASCHLTHGPDAAKAGDSLRRPEWQEGCAACHGPDALPLYRYFHQPDRRKGLGKLKEAP